MRLANFMYSSYTGLSWTMFMLIPSFTAMFGGRTAADSRCVDAR
ncbi:MAG: hypothetical protein ACLS48_08520 [[Eubacterium] siraeum]